MFDESKSIAINANKLAKQYNNIVNEINNSNLPDTKIEEFEKELNNIEKKVKFLETIVQNRVYQITNDTVDVLLFEDVTGIIGLTSPNNAQLQEIAKFLGYKYYKINPIVEKVLITFYNDKIVIIREESL
jgi:uncharacterized protein Yka (UPF0111/DUF47 family)